jgi:hypothetical protein
MHQFFSSPKVGKASKAVIKNVILIEKDKIYYIPLQISQISCLDANKAPSGCTQWFYGTTTGTVINSYNYAGSVQIANQRQSICIR